MNYQEAMSYINEVSKLGSVMGLSSMNLLLDLLGNPQDELKVIYIAGTNGKGSTLAYTSTILEQAGYKVGRYISPTVIEYLEKIQINQDLISEEKFALYLTMIKKACDKIRSQKKLHPTVFEIETALAFLYFYYEACDFVVMETGLGGEFDATNVIKKPIATIFTSIGIDHTEFLGDTIREQATSEAGIIKRGTTVIFGKMPTVAKEIITNQAKEKRANLRYANPEDLIFEIPKPFEFSQNFYYKGMENLKTNLLGRHQIYNATLAIETANLLTEKGYPVSEIAIRSGLEQTQWFGRLTVIKDDRKKSGPVVIVDGAHNKDAAKVLAHTLKYLTPNQKIIGIMGVFKDKDLTGILTQIKPVLHEIYAVGLPDKHRTLTAKTLTSVGQSLGILTTPFATLEDAINQAYRKADVVVIFGSLSHLWPATQIVKRLN